MTARRFSSAQRASKPQNRANVCRRRGSWSPRVVASAARRRGLYGAAPAVIHTAAWSAVWEHRERGWEATIPGCSRWRSKMS